MSPEPCPGWPTHGGRQKLTVLSSSGSPAGMVHFSGPLPRMVDPWRATKSYRPHFERSTRCHGSCRASAQGMTQAITSRNSNCARAPQLLQGFLVRTPGVEPGSQAWKACMIPLHYVRVPERTACTPMASTSLDPRTPEVLAWMPDACAPRVATHAAQAQPA